MDTILDGLTTLLFLPLQLVLIPIDYLLNQIDGISVIPESLQAVAGFIGSLPSTLVSLAGISPILWNTMFALFILYFGMAPSIQIVKKVWAWIRP